MKKLVVVTVLAIGISSGIFAQEKIKWEMNSNDELESVNNFEYSSFENGEFSGKTKYDPCIFLKLPAKEINSSDYNILKVRLYSSATFDFLDFFYSSPNKEWCIGAADVKVEQGWKEYTIDLTNVKWRAAEASSADAAKWGGTTGKVSGLRIDPGNEAGRIVKVDWVELSKGKL